MKIDPETEISKIIDEKNTERSIFNEISVFDETSVLSDDFE